MKTSKKLSLTSLTLNSFVTTFTASENATINGADLTTNNTTAGLTNGVNFCGSQLYPNATGCPKKQPELIPVYGSASLKPNADGNGGTCRLAYFQEPINTTGGTTGAND